MQILYYTSVFFHVVSAAFWVGGMLFLPLVILPGIKNNPDKVSILYSTGLKFRFYGWFAMAILVITGVLNMYLRGVPLTLQALTENTYDILVTYKLFLFAGIIAISGFHDLMMGKKTIEEMQKNTNTNFKLIARWSGRMMLLLSLAMVYIGIILSRGGSI
ncbi:MAG: CopD family protein [Flavobacteriales bacterium]|nr:CopD family protein [Flavobacteriales bacterium]